MSIKFDFIDDKFALHRLKLPSRYYLFDEKENYIKLLNIGEGFFPKDKIKTNVTLQNSNLILTSESATKIYPSKKEFALNSFSITLKNNSNLEFLNDELILFKDSRYIQLFRLNFDTNSTFFYTDILSRGRSFEDFDFSKIFMKNSFYCDEKLEYIEKFEIFGDELKDYIKRKDSQNFIFTKIYIKVKNGEDFLDLLHKSEYESFVFSQNKLMILGVLSGNNMGNLKSKILDIWKIYRKNIDKKEFILGKQ